MLHHVPWSSSLQTAHYIQICRHSIRPPPLHFNNKQLKPTRSIYPKTQLTVRSHLCFKIEPFRNHFYSTDPPMAVGKSGLGFGIRQGIAEIWQKRLFRLLTHFSPRYELPEWPKSPQTCEIARGFEWRQNFLDIFMQNISRKIKVIFHAKNLPSL